MNKYYEVIQQILPLLDTIKEGILHIQNQLVELRYEEALTLLQDAMKGIASIDSVMQPIYDELPENNIDTLFVVVKESMNKAVDSYEQGSESNLENQIEKEVLPSFKAWKEEMEKVLKPYVVS
ncbi:hypothetical protein SAMN05446037_101165 [Anaerovirgula multivorans]|uniref:DUF8042 domain-containing protein n=1 Tax=Anaerovirgula multivorans TaxID=312168 RepID=A0A239EYK3_9FIRM|nr:hypothetical protein [Anaerovirgula multivorans]SNS48924.1 hypothetical protein SAMN05446037_101165 [Anaerovirgula multivorans]